MANPSKYEIKLDSFIVGLNTILNEHKFSYQTKFLNFFGNLLFRIKLYHQFKTQADRYLSIDFNVFDTIWPNENTLSDIIGNILNEKGTHGQGNIFLKGFINFIKLKKLKIPEDNYDYKVLREVSANGRIDILLESDRFAIIIENKPFTHDQQDQINRYYDAMEEKHEGNVAAIYLNRRNDLPRSFSDPKKKEQIDELLSNKGLIIVSYFELTEYLKFCYEKCESEKFRYFLNDFIGYIQKNFKMKEGEEE